MAPRKSTTPNTEALNELRSADPNEVVSLRTQLSKPADFKRFEVWIVGDTPLIVHAWSEKAKREMLSKQVKSVQAGGKAARDPEADFRASLYDLGEDGGRPIYGFPTTGLKNAILSSAHKDKGIPRAAVQSALFLDASMYRTRPALSAAVCDMPLTRIWGSDPEMREDMVKVGSGLNKTATLAYRAQFATWAMKLTGKFNATALPAETLAFLIQEAGISSGIGEWRNERKGVFGAFHLADAAEEDAWERFTRGEGLLPSESAALRMAAE